MISAEPILVDVRIRRQAESLAAAGAHVVVFGTQRSTTRRQATPRTTSRGGVKYRNRLPFESPLAAFASFGQRLLIDRRLAGGGLRQAVRGRLQAVLPSRERQIARLITRFRPTHIHHFDLNTLALAGAITARLGARLVSDLYEAPMLHSEATKPKLIRRVEEEQSALDRYASSAAIRLTVSEPLADYYQAAYPGAPFTVLYNTPKTLSNAPDVRSGVLRQRLRIDPQQPLACYVGLVSLNRGFELILQLLTEFPDLHLVVVGPGGIMQRTAMFEAYLSSMPRPVTARIHALGFQDSDSLPDLLSDADVGLFIPGATTLNLRMTGPNKFFEMLLAGIPLLVSDLGLMGRIVRAEGVGIAVPPGDASAASIALAQILRDPRRYRSDANKIRQLRSIYGWESQERSLFRAYGLEAAATEPAPRSSP